MTRKSIHRFLPLTYAPKIPGVLSGDITQSIRIDTDLKVGDFIAFHGWSGKPYHSPWSFRTPYCMIIKATPINIRSDSIYIPVPGDSAAHQKGRKLRDAIADELAALDGIQPPTGSELIRVLHEMHGEGTLHGKVLRWDAGPIKILKSKVPDNFVRANLLKRGPSNDFIQIGDITYHRVVSGVP